MSAKPEAAEEAPAPVKSKMKLKLIIGAVVALVLVLGGGVAYYFVKKNAAAAAEDGEETSAPVKKADHAAAPPAYLPMDNMVVNLADPGGERVAQVGITLQVTDAHAVDNVKAYLPTIRSGILLLISQRTSEEMLSAEGKEKLSRAILREASLPFGGGDAEAGQHEAPAKGKKKDEAAHAEFPVTGVLFSSFIVQ